MSKLRSSLERRLIRFWYLLDSESIVINQMVFYVLIAFGGLYNLAAAYVPVQAVQESMSSPFYYTAWLWLVFLSPLATIIGKLMRGSYTYAGMWLQLTGDLAVWVMFWTYITATIATSWWGKGNFAAFIVLACLIGTPVFILRDIRRLRQVERRVKRDAA